MTYKFKAVVFIFTFIGLAFLSLYISSITENKLWNDISVILLGIGVLGPALVVGGIAYFSLWEDRKKRNQALRTPNSSDVKENGASHKK